MNVLITLTLAGANTGPFTVYSNADNYVATIASGISRQMALDGFLCTNVPNTATILRVQSLGTCSNYVDLPITIPVTTTTTTTVIPATTTTTTSVAPGTTTTTTTAGGGTTTTTTIPPVQTTTTTTTAGGGGTTTTTTLAPGQTTTTTTTSSGTTTTTTSSPATTTTTTTLAACYTYYAVNNNAGSALLQWTNCDGTPGSENVIGGGTSSTFCAQTGAVFGSNFTITQQSPCTTTTTTTIGPGTTTTTTLAPCYNYFAVNNNAGSATLQWTNCNGTPGSESVIGGGTSSTFCAQTGSVFGVNFTITRQTPCTSPTTTTTTTVAPTTTTTTTANVNCDQGNIVITAMDGVYASYSYRICSTNVLVTQPGGTGTQGQILESGICVRSGTFSSNGTVQLNPTGSCS